MSTIYNSIITELNEAIEDAQSTEKVLKRNTVTIVPIKEYHAADVKKSASPPDCPNTYLQVIWEFPKKR